MSFDICALTADEAAPYVEGNKSKTHNFLNALYNKNLFFNYFQIKIQNLDFPTGTSSMLTTFIYLFVFVCLSRIYCGF
jgi:hypothetical protein